MAALTALLAPTSTTAKVHLTHGTSDGHDHTDVKDDGQPLNILARDCGDSQLPPHDGFEKAPACVSTAFGEVSDAAKNPSLLIVDAPSKVEAGESFSFGVSTRNLVRDRFLGAAQGGYYVESSLLNKDGLQRGHYHVACRVLDNDKEAPVANREPEFFKAVEDGGGGFDPDTVKIEVPGKNDKGDKLFRDGDLVQCAAWAGDGSHRIPMMERANETPAFDAVRIRVD